MSFSGTNFSAIDGTITPAGWNTSQTLAFCRDADSVLDAVYTYPIDLQKLSLAITHCDEFSEIKSKVVGSIHVSTGMPLSAKNTVPSHAEIYTEGIR